MAKRPCCKDCPFYFSKKKEFVMLKGECIVPGSSLKMCDCVIFQNDKQIILVELKSKSHKPVPIVEQFSNGGKIAISIARQFVPKSAFIVHLVLLSDNHGSRYDIKRLKYMTVKIDGRKHRIILGSCKCMLDKLIHGRYHNSPRMPSNACKTCLKPRCVEAPPACLRINELRYRHVEYLSFSWLS